VSQEICPLLKELRENIIALKNEISVSSDLSKGINSKSKIKEVGRSLIEGGASVSSDATFVYDDKFWEASAASVVVNSKNNAKFLYHTAKVSKGDVTLSEADPLKIANSIVIKVRPSINFISLSITLNQINLELIDKLLKFKSMMVGSYPQFQKNLMRIGSPLSANFTHILL
jgi:hypothetical protein